MKQITQLVLAAILGSAITLIAFNNFYDNKATHQSKKVENQKVVHHNNVQPIDTNTAVSKPQNSPKTVATQSHFTNTMPTYQPNPPNNSAPIREIPVDFTAAAAKTMPAVVHITSRQKALGRQSSQRGGGGGNSPDNFDLFRDFFGDEFFRNFGGNGGAPQPRVGTGSGVIISDDGYLITNNHVIKGADEIEVTLYDKQTYMAEVIGTDPSTDLALIKIAGKNLPKLELANSDEAKVGEWVLAVGNPFNLASTVTAGIVSAKGRNLNILQDKAPIESFIQTDAAVNPGNSGGALVDIEGKLLGINTAIATPTGTYAGYSFAVPANIVEKVVADLLSYGIVQRGFLGVLILDLNGKLAKEKKLDLTQGVYVDSLLNDGSAKMAGLQKGDVIVKVDDRTIKSTPTLQEAIGRHRPGDNVNVTVNRNGKEHNLVVTLHNMSGNTGLVTKESTNNVAALGIKVEEISPDDASKFGLRGGLKVTDITNGKVKETTDIREGFVITHIDDQPIESLKDFESVLANKKGSGVLIEGIYPESSNSSYYYGLGL